MTLIAAEPWQHKHTHTHTPKLHYFPSPLLQSVAAGHYSTTGEMLTLFEQGNPYICLHCHCISRKLAARTGVCLAEGMHKKPFQSSAPNYRI